MLCAPPHIINVISHASLVAQRSHVRVQRQSSILRVSVCREVPSARPPVPEVRWIQNERVQQVVPGSSVLEASPNAASRKSQQMPPRSRLFAQVGLQSQFKVLQPEVWRQFRRGAWLIRSPGGKCRLSFAVIKPRANATQHQCCMQCLVRCHGSILKGVVIVRGTQFFRHVVIVQT